MKIGLLQCDPGDYGEMFARWLPAEWRVYDLLRGEAPGSLSECDAYATTGSRFSVYDDEPWIHDFAALVRTIYEAGRPLLGVCFGHQMIAHALGGRVARSARGWGIGVHEFTVVQREPWMNPPLDAVRVLMSCQDQVEELPPGAAVLAQCDFCPVGMYRVGTLLGIQGHPEFSPEYAESLMLARINRIGAEKVEGARQTLRGRIDSRELAQWAARFLEM